MKGIKLAQSLLENNELKEWRLRRQRQYTTQTMYVDSIVPFYHVIMEALSGQARKVFAIVCDKYGQGIRPTDIAKETFLPVNTVTAIVRRLANAGLIVRTKQGRNALYNVPHRDLTLVHAMRSRAFEKYHKKHRNDVYSINDFICMVSTKRTITKGKGNARH